MRSVAVVLIMMFASAAVAQGIGSSPRPVPNPVYGGQVAVAVPVAVARAGAVLQSSVRPKPRPRGLTDRIAVLRAAVTEPARAVADAETDLSSIPAPTRQERRKQRREQQSMKGAVCGVPSIKGQEIAPIRSRVKGCGVRDPVAVTSVAGVRLSQTATVDCSIAKALNAWVDEVAQPAFDGKLVELRVAAHYICRTRNNRPGAKISEHGKGTAIDISAFVLSNGRALTVRENYNRLLRRIYKAGCAYFRTTLGPGSDGYHEDHFHFDMAARQGGRYCR